MRIVFAGTPPFAATALAALLDQAFYVCMVLSQPDRPSGRGQRTQASAVKRLALERQIPVLTPSTLRPQAGDAAAAMEQLQAAAPDVLVVAAYGLLLPEAVLQLPRGLPLADGARLGAINIHASLLPRWRGAAPVARAIEAGDTRTGITIMEMDAGLDTGPILMMEEMEIDAQDSAGSLTERLAHLGADLLVRALRELALGRLQRRSQPEQGVMYARKLDKAEAWLDWREPASVVAARVRAFDPFPGACGSMEGMTVKIWSAQLAPAEADHADSVPGTVVGVGAQGIEVACGQGSVLLTELQRPGGRRLIAREFLAGTPIAAGARWLPADANAHGH